MLLVLSGDSLMTIPGLDLALMFFPERGYAVHGSYISG